jgi:copper chaperone NosL
MKRRDLLKLSLAGSAAGLVAAPLHATETSCAGDGTPNQFIPKKPADANPLASELEKYGKCPYCGMDRKEHNKTRMLVQYSDNLVDGVCSIHCLALSLGLNIDREPLHIWGPDYASTAEVSPLAEVDQRVFLIGANLKHAMTKRSKHAFASIDSAREFQAKYGGELGNFDDALTATYLDMSQDVTQIRKMRAERRKKMMEQKQG